MAWSTITNFASSDTDIVGELNQFSGNLSSLRLFNDHAAHLSLLDDMTIPDATVEIITWDVVEYQVGSLWSAGQPTRFTAPVTGYYGVIYTVEWRTSIGGERTMGVKHQPSGTRYDLSSQGSTYGGGSQSGMDEIYMASGDHLTAHVFHSYGSSLGIRGDGRDRTNIFVWLMGVV